MWRRIWELDAEIQGLMVTVREENHSQSLNYDHTDSWVLTLLWWKSEGSALIARVVLRHDTDGQNEVLLCFSRLSLPMKYGGLMVEKNLLLKRFTPLLLMCSIRNISFCFFLPQWCFMVRHRRRSSGNWVPPKSSPPVARTEVPCRMERSAFTATGTLFYSHLGVIKSFLSTWVWWLTVLIFLNTVPMKGSPQLGLSHWLLPQRPFRHVALPTLWGHIPCMNRLLPPSPTQH